MADTFSEKGAKIKNAILRSKEEKETILNNLFGEVMAEEPKKKKKRTKVSQFSNKELETMSNKEYMALEQDI